MTDPAADRAALQGLWKLVSLTSRGATVGTGTTHWLVDGDRVQKINPHSVDGGPWARLVLDPAAAPKRLAVVYETSQDDGTVRQRESRTVYELAGDGLRVWHASVYGQWPAAASDADYMVEVLTRDPGPPPATKRASGIAPIDDDVLGPVTWDDDLDEWNAKVTLRPGQAVDLSCSEPDGSAAVALLRLTVDWLPVGDPAARRYAATVMLDLFNDTWRQDDTDPHPITPAAFAKRLTLGGVAVTDGSLELWYDDGGLFAGHSVAVSADADRNFTDAGMHG